MQETKDMLMINALCLYCGHKWKAFCPEGLRANTYLQCPECNRMEGIDAEAGLLYGRDKGSPPV